MGDASSKTVNEIEQPPPELSLAHELGHAEAMIEGTVDPAPETRSYRDIKGTFRTETQRRHEFNAVKVENAIRKEQGHKERVAVEPAR